MCREIVTLTELVAFSLLQPQPLACRYHVVLSARLSRTGVQEHSEPAVNHCTDARIGLQRKDVHRCGVTTKTQKTPTRLLKS
jgi:hypothetical protein